MKIPLPNRSPSLTQALSERPVNARRAVVLFVATILLFDAFSLQKYQLDSIPITQLCANIFVFSLFLFLPWRIWLAGKYTRLFSIFMLINWTAWDVYPLFFGIYPSSPADVLVTYFVAVPIQLATLYFLCSPTTTAWFTRVKEARAAA